jgi:hypothetical protein
MLMLAGQAAVQQLTPATALQTHAQMIKSSAGH